jgi:hypothetical protein
VEVNIDVTNEILARYAASPAGEIKRGPSTPPLDLHRQAAEMFVWMAAHAVGHIGTGSAA